MSFVDDIKKFRQTVENKSSQIARKVAIDLHSRIVERTPVDTGRLLANNHLTIGSPSTASTIDKDKEGDRTKAAAESVSKSYKLGDDIWISNNLVYAYPIEFLGHSSVKRPEGFFRVSVQDIIQAWPSIVSEAK